MTDLRQVSDITEKKHQKISYVVGVEQFLNSVSEASTRTRDGLEDKRSQCINHTNRTPEIKPLKTE